MGSRKEPGNQGLTLLAGMFVAFLLMGGIAVGGAASIAEVWSVPISDISYSLSVSYRTSDHGYFFFRFNSFKFT